MEFAKQTARGRDWDTTHRVLRGGSWGNINNHRSANRNRNAPGNINHNVGFRVCCVASTPHSQNRRKRFRRACKWSPVRVPAMRATASKNQPRTGFLVASANVSPFSLQARIISAREATRREARDYAI
ncbi:MAG TPA: SUMF1/EgtB/PvdO family nonheme iron enzyme [Blastocatellia bacterium]|nr:SUMF1/EgtB/PvdO family nonheme iron enzyme [Blastocatellia bacterium]